MKSKKLKGFTLIELIIVLAIFGLLIMGALQLVDPVSKIATRTSTRENNSAAVDNVKQYLEGSLRYAQYINVFSNEYNNAIYSNWGSFNSGNCHISGGVAYTGTAQEKREAAMKAFVEKYFDGREGPDFCNKCTNCNAGKYSSCTDSGKHFLPLRVTVRAIEIDNASGGSIREYMYDFESGNSFKKSDGNVVREVKPGKALLGNGTNPINPIYINQNFYFKLGYNRLTADGVSGKTYPYSSNLSSTPPKDKTIYWANIEDEKEIGGTNAAYPISSKQFGITIATYSDRFNSSGKGLVFQSPMALTNSSMALTNINTNNNNKLRDYYKVARTLPDGAAKKEAHPVQGPAFQVYRYGNDYSGNGDIVSMQEQAYGIALLGSDTIRDHMDKIFIIYVLPSDLHYEDFVK